MSWTRRDFLAGVGVVAGVALGGVLRGSAKRASGAALLRPPGAQPEPDFLAACIRCEQCIEACPWDTLRMAGVAAGLGIGTPYLVSRAIPCYVCEGYDELLCVAACPTDALLPVPKIPDIRMGTAVIDEAVCIAYFGVICRACWHACPIDAVITFDRQNRPIVNEETCIGCGLCDHACPTTPSSIPIRPGAASELPSRAAPGAEKVE